MTVLKLGSPWFLNYLNLSKFPVLENLNFLDSCEGNKELKETILQSILKTCQPRADIISGSFNPEIFTANLSEVIEYYQNGESTISSIYTDAVQFFRDATYPTDNLKMVLNDVFGRLSGDNARPALHRLETAFGGGKTHALIACTHIGYRGKALSEFTGHVIDEELLPEPNEISVIGVRGDEISVHKSKGKTLIPYTLWGELAHQVGGEKLYKEVQIEAESVAAPGKQFFKKVFGDKKILILLDELALYAARSEAARKNGGEQLAAFLFSLHGYARSHAGIVIVEALAGLQDAFADQTKLLATTLSEITGSDLDEDDAISIGQKAVDSVESVAFRDTAPGVIPVKPGEISHILAKRLFTKVDESVAEVIAKEYAQMYKKNGELLPAQATRADYEERIKRNYPFHPTLIDFLNRKLSTSENFQGTRGVLRVLSLAIRNIWREKVSLPMVHICHLNLRDSATAGELLGRTGSSDLLNILNTDVGGPDTNALEAGRSNAEEADLNNPHPEGFPMYEYTWRTVFLHSLVGRQEGLSSNVFGVTEKEALLDTAFPSLTPPQVRQALDQIEELDGGAFYLRFKQGKYFASDDPSIRSALSRIWNSMRSQTAKVRTIMNDTARKVVRQDMGNFRVEPDVTSPGHLPDNQEKPMLAIISLEAGKIDVQQYITTTGDNKPRERQNLVFLLVPNTVTITGDVNKDLFTNAENEAKKAFDQIEENARWALAIKELRNHPEDHGIYPSTLDQDDFKQRASEREKALETAITQAYQSLWYPSASGNIIRKEVKTAGGESGASVIERVRKVLLDDNELVTREDINTSTLSNFASLFFQNSEIPKVDDLKNNFLCKRNWPVLEKPELFDQIIREGISRNNWCMFAFQKQDSTSPEEFYDSANTLPLDLVLSGAEYHLITPQNAKKRRWTAESGPDKYTIQEWILTVLQEYHVRTVKDLRERVINEHGEVDNEVFSMVITDMLKANQMLAFKGKPDQEEKPQLIVKETASLYSPDDEDVILTKAEAAKRGWLSEEQIAFEIKDNREVAKRILPLLKWIGSLYNKGAKSNLDEFDLYNLHLPEGGDLRISIHNAPPESVKRLGELFEVLAGVVQDNGNAKGVIRIDEPDEDCIFLKALKHEGEKDQGDE